MKKEEQTIDNEIGNNPQPQTSDDKIILVFIKFD